MEALKQRVKEVLELNLYSLTGVKDDEVYIYYTNNEYEYHKIIIVKFYKQDVKTTTFKYYDKELGFIGGDEILYSKCKKMEMLFKEVDNDLRK